MTSLPVNNTIITQGLSNNRQFNGTLSKDNPLYKQFVNRYFGDINISNKKIHEKIFTGCGLSGPSLTASYQVLLDNLVGGNPKDQIRAGYLLKANLKTIESDPDKFAKSWKCFQEIAFNKTETIIDEGMNLVYSSSKNNGGKEKGTFSDLNRLLLLTSYSCTGKTLKTPPRETDLKSNGWTAFENRCKQLDLPTDPRKSTKLAIAPQLVILLGLSEDIEDIRNGSNNNQTKTNLKV